VGLTRVRSICVHWLEHQKIAPVQAALSPELLDKPGCIFALAYMIAAKHTKQGRQSKPINGGNWHRSWSDDNDWLHLNAMT
jgi:hypothetical protein